MANRLKIETKYTKGAWQVTSTVDTESSEDFPREVFLWTLDKKGALNEFQAIGHIDQVARYPLYDPVRTSNFGIHLVRTDSGVQTFSSEEDVDKAIVVLKSAFTFLTNGFDAESEPVIEYYP